MSGIVHQQTPVLRRTRTSSRAAALEQPTVLTIHKTPDNVKPVVSSRETRKRKAGVVAPTTIIITSDVEHKKQPSDGVRSSARILQRATHTSLAAPAEIARISSKRRKIDGADHQQQQPLYATNTVADVAAAAATVTQDRRRNIFRTPLKPAGYSVCAPSAPQVINTALKHGNPLLKAGSPRKHSTLTTTTTANTQSRQVTTRSSAARKRHEAAAVKKEAERAAADQWLYKYTEWFPTFRFYFDDVPDPQQKFERVIVALGARVEGFFSKDVTHVISYKAVDKHDSASNTAAAATARPSITTNLKSGHALQQILGHKDSNITSRQSQFPTAITAAVAATGRNSSISPVKNGKQPTTVASLAGPIRRSKAHLGLLAANANAPMPTAVRTPPKSRINAGDVQKAEPIELVAKALAMKLSVWHPAKLERILTRLTEGNKSPEKGVFAQPVIEGHAPRHEKKPSIASMLKAEQLTGSTYERDSSVLRKDHHYPALGHAYLLVEDTLRCWQPAHAKDYEYPVLTREQAYATDGYSPKWPILHGGSEARCAFQKAHPSLPAPKASLEMIRKNRDATLPHDLTTFDVRQEGLRRSASTLALRGADLAVQPKLKESREYQAASGNSQIITSNIASATSTRSGQAFAGVNKCKGSTNSLANGVIIDKRLARLGSKHQHVVKLGGRPTGSLLGATKAGIQAPSALKRTLSVDSGLQNVTTVKPREEPKKAGYCENCRVRYDDFKAHTRGKRHRRFALEASNWYELDNLLAVIGRPVVPELLELYAAAKVEPPSDIDCSEGDSDEDSDSEIEAASSESLSTSNAAMNDSGFEDQIARVHDLKRKIAAITGSDSSSSDSDSEEDSEEAPTEDDEDSDEVEDV